jgi:Putative MetA-pathway of phenol degradation
MTADRPDFTDAPDVIGRGLWQVESGFLFATSHVDTATIHETTHEIVTPQALVRIGLSPRLELRVATDGLLSVTTSQQGVGRISGRSDLAVSVKWRLFDDWRPGGFDLALLPILSLPTGSDGFTSGGYDPTLKVSWDIRCRTTSMSPATSSSGH